ncbi:hypothetical protein AVEN_249257-1 [Araneus ventricosus]|uniref:Uncharacterized protein n=1 Tax=Araneus ventricosus TaxID=182803 RepID=A0A4Y2KDI1_ARAVE|nr:hypothetical protein AVEN_249257-1 [Araneus ventricosus]
MLCAWSPAPKAKSPERPQTRKKLTSVFSSEQVEKGLRDYYLIKKDVLHLHELNAVPETMELEIIAGSPKNDTLLYKRLKIC